MYPQKDLYVATPEIEIAIEEFQKAMKRLLAKEIMLDECLEYQNAVFEACNKYNRYLEKVNGIYQIKKRDILI